MQPRVLVVDDDPLTRRLAESALGSHCEVVTADDGATALVMARRMQPDLIISDLVMPVLDGVGLKHRLAADARLAATPFIFLTSRSDEETRLASLLTGADDYLTKPVDVRRLLRRVEVILERARRVREASLECFTREIDAAFVPGTLPCIPGYELAIAVQPAATGGGDIVDVATLADGSLLMLQADVMGKGARAKFFAYAFIGYLRGLLYGGCGLPAAGGPAAIMDRLGRLYGNDPLLQDFYVTGALLQFEPRRHWVRSCCAGAIPAFVLVPDADGARRLAAGGGVPGVFEAPYAEEACVLRPGAALVLVSDGVTEARDAGGTLWGEEGVGATLEPLRHAAAQTICDAILAAAANWSQGAATCDDRTVVVLRRLAGESWGEEGKESA
jgi:serine phosphatase RsbU (regulator of sigma subunit)